jgi:exodeoxyribonuclease-1
MLFRYRARNYPDTLNPEERMRWEKYRRTRLTSPDGGGGITMCEYRTQIEKLRKQPELTGATAGILDALAVYGNGLLPEIQSQDGGSGETKPA